jgi:hypothetical protein
MELCQVHVVFPEINLCSLKICFLFLSDANLILFCVRVHACVCVCVCVCGRKLNNRKINSSDLIFILSILYSTDNDLKNWCNLQLVRKINFIKLKTQMCILFLLKPLLFIFFLMMLKLSFIANVNWRFEAKIFTISFVIVRYRWLLMFSANDWNE